MKWMVFTVLIAFNYSFGTIEKTEDTSPAWVQELIDTSPDMTKVVKCKWGEKEVWKVNTCTICNDMLTKVFDKDKNLLCEYGGVLQTNSCEDNNIHYTDCEIVHQPKGLFGF